MSLADLVNPPKPAPRRQGRRVTSARVLDERVKAQLLEETDRAYKSKLAEAKRAWRERNKSKLAEAQRAVRPTEKETKRQKRLMGESPSPCGLAS